MAEEKKFDNEMRGTFWENDRRGENGPVMKGTMQISGVMLRVIMWPKRTAPEKDGKPARVYVPFSVEYPQGATRFLSPVNPANVVVTGAEAGSGGADADGADAAGTVDDMPF